MERPAYDSIGQALGGLYTVMNDADDVRLTGTCVADLITGMTVTLGVLASLMGRERGSGREGVHLETSVLEAVSTLTVDAMTQALEADMDPRRETRHPQAQNFCLRTATGDFIVIHLSSSEKFWRAFMGAVGREDLVEDPRFATYVARSDPPAFRAIKAILEAEFLKQSRDEWERRLAAADVPFAPALTMRQVVEHPQVQWLQLTEPVASGASLLRPPLRFDGERPRRETKPPHIGEHTREVLRDFLSEPQFDVLAAKGVILERAAPAPDDVQLR
jgi:formyl-CoA transferase